MTHSNKPFGFGTDPDHDWDPGIYSRFLPLQDKDDFTNFVPSATLEEVCTLWVLLLSLPRRLCFCLYLFV